MTVCLQCRVRGRVQGVGFRAATERKAEALELRGYVRNLDNGGVQVLACGAPEPVEVLREWLWQGPAGARVEGVECEAASAADAPAGFRID